MNLESITGEIIELNNKIKQLELLREEELKKEENWYLTPYKLNIMNQESNDKLKIESNYGSYSYAKDNYKQDLLYIEIGDGHGGYSTGLSLTLNQSKMLSDYLLKVIKYMEEE